jgi:hypothetical protein
MNEFTADQLKRTTKLLMDCATFSNETQLRTLFIDPRIRPWQHQIPSQPENFGDLIKRTITLLLNKRNRKHENALVLFLEVLADNIDEEDFCHEQIINLGSELKAILNRTPPVRDDPQTTKVINRHMLYTILEDQFNISEIQDLCFQLKVEYENIPGSTKKDKARELVLFMSRRKKLSALVSAIQEIRPGGILELDDPLPEDSVQPEVPVQMQVITATVNLLHLTLEGALGKWTLCGTNKSDEAINKVIIILRPPLAITVSPNVIQLGSIQSGQTKQADDAIIIRPNRAVTGDSFILPIEVTYATPSTRPKRYNSEFHIPVTTNQGISR